MIKTKFRLGQWVRIVGKPRIDGTTDAGIIVGVELSKYAFHLGFFSKREFEESFKTATYKVAYQNDFTKIFTVEWFAENDIFAERRKVNRDKD